MPELPEVEALAGILDVRLRGRRIAGLTVASIAALKTYDPPPAALAGREVAGVRRHGKFLDLEAMSLDEGGYSLHLVAHLGRAGWVHWREQASAARLAQRGPLAARLRFEDGAAVDLTEQGTEKRLALHVVRDPTDVAGVGRLGVDALDEGLDLGRLAELLRGRPGTLKTVLSDQSVIAGVGNAYSDEILHAARLSPFARGDRLDDEALVRLLAALRETLGSALEQARGLDIDGLKEGKRAGMRVHGRSGQPCPVCGDTVREVSLASRSFQYCPRCQTGGRIYANRRMSRLLR
ncbi:MAG: DNA-formamidopyrimidine glycosylase family protein [Candidatus Dormibacteria bacterium]|jgi:formamidopyrimidine-DNA glycosylase